MAVLCATETARAYRNKARARQVSSLNMHVALIQASLTETHISIEESVADANCRTCSKRAVQQHLQDMDNVQGTRRRKGGHLLEVPCVLPLCSKAVNGYKFALVTSFSQSHYFT